MRTDIYGQQIYDEMELCLLYLQDPSRKLKKVFVEKEIKFDDTLQLQNIPELIKYNSNNISIEEFDTINQNNWFMPEEYKSMDIAKFVLDQCKNEAELQRAGEELLLFQERNMFTLLCYLKYLVDTMRKNNIVWGVGRGSSVASFVLFLLGVHRINSLYYDLSIAEFLK
jgi:DNA polymerase III alpha subunit